MSQEKSTVATVPNNPKPPRCEDNNFQAEVYRSSPLFFDENSIEAQQRLQNKAHGWVSVYRSLMYSKIWKNSYHVKALLYLFFRAQYKESPEPFGPDNIKLQPGQVLTSQKRMEDDTDLTREQVRRFFSAIKLHKIATIKTTKKWTVVTLVNWEFYQSHDISATKKRTKRTTKRQPRDNQQTTIYNKGNNKKRNNGEKSTPPTINEVRDFFNEKGYTSEGAEKAFNHYDLADWHDANGNPVKNWKQKCSTNWFRPEFKLDDTAISQQLSTGLTAREEKDRKLLNQNYDDSSKRE